MRYSPRPTPYVGDGIFLPPGCFRSDDRWNDSVRCSEPVAWRGLTVNRRGRRIYVEACEFHGADLGQRRRCSPRGLRAEG
jgi:hypothetical protein